MTTSQVPKKASNVQLFEYHTQGATSRLLRFVSLPPANELWGKVISLHLFVILFTGGVCLSACWDIPQGGAPPEETPLGGDPPGAQHAGRYGQRTGGTHPTGMQSCFR